MKKIVLIAMLMLAACVTKIIILPGGGMQVCVICEDTVYCFER
jgi:hypothetical protein